ncbi:MAG: RNA ligase family protein [Aulosira sp. ZfuVER01]|nr:RNA ligase family protein [Aulosira sp. ZfuVER01]MDZ7996476.1 RNA ligase family protein [Aulosira sp. DedVER01a]MDZ8056192.1 RNA ligase family protein [Aulosira sp. ZfuCHP01]
MDTVDSNVTDWTYLSYEKIPENSNKWGLTESDYRLFNKTEWMVTEKIHGANFGITTDGSEVRFAKRKEFLQPEDDFFGYQSLKDKLAHQVKEIFRILQLDTPWQKIYVYGELFGGDYPHPDIPAVNYVQAVQTGVYYSPKIEYCAFDIVGLKSENTAVRYYLDYEIALKLFQQVEMMAAAPLFIGKYNDALAYNIEFESTIPAILGLPKLPCVNKAEGVIIKPLHSIYIDTGKEKIRPIIKRKIPEFAEDSRFHQAKKWTVQQQPIITQQLSLEEELSQEMLALVTLNRLNNVISKVGRVAANNIKQRQKLVKLLVNDVLESFQEEYESIFNALEDTERQSMIEELNQASQQLVDDYCQ